LPLRVTEAEVIVYSPQLEEVARHGLVPRGQTGQYCVQPGHRPSADPRQHEALLRERFAQLGPVAARFLDGLLASQRYGKEQAVKVLALQSSYARADLLAALERAVRFGAYSLGAVERILAAQAQPKSVLETLADAQRRCLPPHLSDNPVSPRPTTAYHRLGEGAIPHGPPPETPTDHDPADRPAADDDAGGPA